MWVQPGMGSSDDGHSYTGLPKGLDVRTFSQFRLGLRRLDRFPRRSMNSSRGGRADGSISSGAVQASGVTDDPRPSAAPWRVAFQLSFWDGIGPRRACVGEFAAASGGLNPRDPQAEQIAHLRVDEPTSPD